MKAREVGVQEASHVYVREGAVIRPLDAMYRGPYHVLVWERKKNLLEIGATWTWVSVDCCSSEAEHGCGGPSGSTAASTWTPAQVLVYK